MTSNSRLFWLITICLSAMIPTGHGIAASTYPDKPLEFFVHSRPGSGVDILARMVARVLIEEKIVTQPITIQNRAGAGGANAINYINRKKGDSYVLWMPSSNFATTDVRGLPDAYFTPVALLESENPVLVVKADSSFKTVKDLIAAAKAKPGHITLGIGTYANPDHQAAIQLAKAGGVEFNYVLLQGGAQAVTTLLAGDTQFNFGDYIEVEGHVKAKTLRLLGVGAPKRLKFAPDLPTLTEQGYPVIQETLRGVVMPADIPAEVVAYWENALERMSKAKSWQAYLKEGRKTDAFAKGAGLAKAFQQLAARERPIIKELRSKK